MKINKILSVLIITLFLANSVSFGVEETATQPEAVLQSDAAPQPDVAPQPDTATEEAPAPANEMSFDETLRADATLSPLPAESETEAPLDQSVIPGPGGIEEKVSLDLRNIEITEALRFLAQKGGLNLVVSKNVAGRVQLQLNDVPIKDILDILLVSNQLAYEKSGDIYYVMTEAEYKERYGRKFSDTRKVRVFRLKYAVPDQAFSLFEALKSEIGRLLVDPESGTVLIMDTQENIDRMEKALEGLEQKRSVKVYSLKYAKALEVETRLKSQLDTKKVGFVLADERTNQIMVETLPGRMVEIDQLVEALDQKTREVLIDAKIIKVTLSNDLAAEIKWEGIVKEITKTGTDFLSNHPFSALARTGTSFVDDFVNIAPTTRPTAGTKNVLTENLFLGAVHDQQAFEVLINFLRTIGETKVLSNPKLAVVNNQEAKIHVGEKQAYVTTTTTTGQTTSTTAESVTFVDVGIKLSVTPTINEDGFVTMKIRPEISSVVSSLITPSGNKIPIIDSSLAETTVMVKDGVSIIIGGLRKDEKVETRKKVPVLGDIPILGAPFNSYTTATNHTELLILITPHIVYGDNVTEGSRKPGEAPFMPYADYAPFPAVPMDKNKEMLKSQLERP